jgi:GTP-binding protein
MDIAFLISAFRAHQYPPPDRPEIAFAGKSNVGKSSLINVLINRKGLARTSSTPGRTQSINFFSMGESLYLVDLPGYGFARVPMKVKKSWQGMVETYLSERSNLKAVVVILDIRRDVSSGDMDLLGWLKHYGIHAIPVLTKADKLSRQKARTRANVITRKLKDLSTVAPILFSAKTKEGKEEIWDKIRLVSDSDLPVPR